ncbi:MAG: RNA-binding domain-containing protein [Isosphaeraceae bacterium]
MTESAFEELLIRMEGESIDFKGKDYPNLVDEVKKVDFIKDTICMVNTPREGPAYLMTGVKKSTNGQPQLWGIDAHPDDADLQSQFTDWVQPHPRFHYEAVQYRGRDFGVIEIPAAQLGPCYPIRDYGNVLRRKTLYFGRGSKNDVAEPAECHKIIAWFEQAGRAAGPVDSEEGPPWDAFRRAVSAFDSSRRFVLFSTPMGDYEPTVLGPLGRLPWTAVFDFDSNSDQGGLLRAVKPTLEARRSLHYVTLGQAPVSDPARGTMWFFALGLAGRPESLVLGDCRKWRRVYRKEIQDQLERVFREVSPAPMTCVVLAYGSEFVDHLKFTLERAQEIFGEAADFTLVTDVRDVVEELARDLGASLFSIPMTHLSHGLANLALNDESNDGHGVDLPSSSGIPITPEASRLRWLQAEVDLVGINASEVPPQGREVGKDFLRGAPIAWCDLANHIDVERTKADKLKRILDEALRRRQAVRVNLYHAPGAGGTTLAHRLLWNYRRSYPCAILRQCNSPPETVARLEFLASETGQCVLLLVDGARVAERQVDDLYTLVRSRQFPMVFLQSLRRDQPQEERQRSIYLEAELDVAERNRFAVALSRQVPAKQKELEELSLSTDPRKHTAFYFGLQTFGSDFLGLEPYVRERLSALSDVQREIIVFMSLAHHYAQRTIPQQAFAPRLGLPQSRPIKLDRILPSEALDLLVKVDEDRGGWRPAHELVASEILIQLLIPGGGDRRNWRQRLSVWAEQFAVFCRGDDSVGGEELLEVVRRTFVYRDNRDDLGTERSSSARFAKLIEDIPSHEGQLECLRSLVEVYPEEPHFLAHLGRFYYLIEKDYHRALEIIDRAIAQQPDDHVLHHMRGMAVRSQVYQPYRTRSRCSRPLIWLRRRAPRSRRPASLPRTTSMATSVRPR